MKRAAPSAWPPILVAFVVWFVHFMLCWAAVEIWPGQWPANAVAWTATPVALLALGAQGFHLGRRRPAGELTDWARRIGRGAVAIAAVAVTFITVPSLVFVP